MVELADAPSVAPDTFGGLVRDGETPEAALNRLEKTKAYTKTIGSDEGQRLLAAATAQVKAQPNGGLNGRKREPTRLQAEAHAAAATATSSSTAPRAVAAQIVDVPLDLIDVGTNVRVNVDEIDELTASIQEHGVLQPIKVRPAGDRFTIVWGQRRFLASRQAGLTSIPAIIDVEVKTTSVLAIEQLVENLHRADLPPLDRARAMRAVVDAGMSQVDLARELGIHTSTISNDLGLLESPREIQTLIEAGSLTPSHAKALKGLTAKEQRDLAEDVVERGWSAHETEERVQNYKRNAEWQAKQAAEQRDVAERRKAHAIEALEKKEVPKGARIHVTGYYGDDSTVKSIALAMRKAGFTDVREGIRDSNIGDKAETLGCTCEVWRVDVTSYGDRPGVKPACTVQAHRDAKWKAKSAADAAERAFHDRVKVALRERVRTDLATGVVTPIVARVALWVALDWSLTDWVKSHKGDRKKPDAWGSLTDLEGAPLIAELSEHLAKAFGDRYGVKLDWNAIATEVGVEIPAPPEPKAKPAKGKKAATS